MAQEWIKAPLALKYVSLGESDFSARLRICERAHHGLIAAKADRITWDGQEARDELIGKRFWWAEGHEALEQDWQAGDFSTWIDHKIEVKVFGASFDFAALADLVPADKQATALRAISVLGSADWIGARDLHSAVFAKHGSASSSILAEACRLGQIGARAMRATRTQAGRSAKSEPWIELEWDVPLWFWRELAEGKRGRFEWSSGKVRGESVKDGIEQKIQLQGLHFHRSGLESLGLADWLNAETETEPKKRGRKPTYDWPAASTAVWGQILRGELIPANQADVERAFLRHLAKGSGEPSESTVRPFAKPIWDEFSKA